jgi:hypothetical protein
VLGGCHIRLESPHERPEERADVKRPHLIEWVIANRDQLLAAALTILKAYHLAGRPDFNLMPASITPPALLATLSRRGFTVRAVGGFISVIPASELTADDREAIRQRRDELLAVLSPAEPWNLDTAIRLMDEADALVEQLSVDGRHPAIAAAAMVSSAFATRDRETVRFAVAEFAVRPVAAHGAGPPTPIPAPSTAVPWAIVSPAIFTFALALTMSKTRLALLPLTVRFAANGSFLNNPQTYSLAIVGCSRCCSRIATPAVPVAFIAADSVSIRDGVGMFSRAAAAGPSTMRPDNCHHLAVGGQSVTLKVKTVVFLPLRPAVCWRDNATSADERRSGSGPGGGAD